MDDELREEENARRREEWARREALAERKQKELERLKKTQKFAKQWRRATELRQYADALERVGSGPSAAASVQSLEAELVWIRNAADWLDPLTQKHWPSVDGDELDAARGKEDE